MKLEDLKRPDYKNIVKESRCAAEPVFKSSAAREENNGVIHKLLMGNSFLALRSTDMDDFSTPTPSMYDVCAPIGVG